MKKTILGLAALLMVSASFAQPTHGKFNKGDRFERRQHGPRQAFAKLNLTDAQKQQMKSINEDFRKQMQALNAQENIIVKQQRDQRQALLKAHKEKTQSILTPEQKQQLAQFKADAEKKMTERRDQRLSHLKTELGLSEEQVASIKNKEAATHQKLEALRNDDKLSGSEKRQQLMALRDEMHSNLETVLTPEQKAKFENMKKDRGPARGHFRGAHGPQEPGEVR